MEATINPAKSLWRPEHGLFRPWDSRPTSRRSRPSRQAVVQPHLARSVVATSCQEAAANLRGDLPPNFPPGFPLIPFRYRRLPGEGSSGQGLGKGTSSPNPLAELGNSERKLRAAGNCCRFIVADETLIALRCFFC
jgi:hypothetical protein